MFTDVSYLKVICSPVILIVIIYRMKPKSLTWHSRLFIICFPTYVLNLISVHFSLLHVSFTVATCPLPGPQTQNAFQHLVLLAWNALPGTFKPFSLAPLKYYLVEISLCFFFLTTEELIAFSSFFLCHFLNTIVRMFIALFGLCCMYRSFSKNRGLLKEFGWVEGGNVPGICQPCS